MLNASQLRTFYPDLADERVESAIAMVHSRFSTNTFPSWPRAHPYRYISHNGEINTLRGNVNWMHARQSQFASKLFGDDLKKVLPAVDIDGSDSAILDNVLELLHLSGWSLPRALMMLVPEPWQHHESMSPEKRAFYEFHSCLMEPWDGPASIAFTDGTRVGATLDRNGLRPARYYVTKDGRVIMASEAGVLDIPPANVLAKGRLQPGRMFLVDTAEQRIVSDDELKQRVSTEQPYGEWVRDWTVRLTELPPPPRVIEPDHQTVLRRQEVFGYTAEDVRTQINAMAQTGTDPVGSMGNDAPLAVLSERPQLLYSYFKQLFAQVTNPPIDAIREEIITASEMAIGPEGNLLEPGPQSAHQLELPSPVLTNEELEKIRHLGRSRPARVQDHHSAHPLQRGGRRGRPAPGHRAGPRSGLRGDRRGAQHHHPLGPRPQRAGGPHPGPPRRRRRPPPPGPFGHSNAGRPRPGVGRAARGPSLRPARRLRRQRRQPVPGLRDRPRPGPAGHDRRARP